MSDISLDGSGLMEMGHYTVLPSDDLPRNDGTIVMLGPDEPAFWCNFKQSPEYLDGDDDPMDRWSKRVIDDIAATHGGTAYYPFGGAPFLPFYSWALRTNRAWSSPIQFLVHDTAGLFASYRGAIWIPEKRAPITSAKPCSSCVAPCKSACPVDAFAQGYDVAACKTYLDTNAGNACLSEGCAARRACPVGNGRRLAAQAAFHMEAFR